MFRGYCYRQEWCALFSCFVDIGDVGIMRSSSIDSRSVDVFVVVVAGVFFVVVVVVVLFCCCFFKTRRHGMYGCLLFEILEIVCSVFELLS